MLKFYFKKIVNKICQAKYLDNEKLKEPQKFHFVEGLLYSLLIHKQAVIPNEKLNILQIGANDGFTVDPLYRFCSILEPGNTRLAAVEPLPEIYENLNKTYANHPEFVSYQSLIGNDNVGQLYKIKSKYWSHYKGLTGSGISSMSYEHVINKVRKQLPRKILKNKDFSDFIERDSISCITLNNLINIWGNFPDFIQIDVEGEDDNVIYTLDLSKYKPKAICFETTLLNNYRKENIFKHLESNGYLITQASSDDHCALLKDVLYLGCLNNV